MRPPPFYLTNKWPPASGHRPFAIPHCPSTAPSNPLETIASLQPPSFSPSLQFNIPPHTPRRASTPWPFLTAPRPSPKSPRSIATAAPTAVAAPRIRNSIPAPRRAAVPPLRHLAVQPPVPLGLRGRRLAASSLRIKPVSQAGKHPRVRAEASIEASVSQAKGQGAVGRILERMRRLASWAAIRRFGIRDRLFHFASSTDWQPGFASGRGGKPHAVSCESGQGRRDCFVLGWQRTSGLPWFVVLSALV